MSARYRTEPTEAGEQSLVPGVAPIGLRERLEERMAAPLAAPRPQKPMDIGLFDTAARDQLELFGPGGRLVPKLPPAGG